MMRYQLKYFWWRTLRQLPAALIVFLLCAAITALAAIKLPTKVTATAFLMAELPRISQSQSETAQWIDAAHLQRLTNRVTTDRSLRSLATEQGLSMDVDQLRESTNIKIGSGRDKATTVSISVTHSNAATAVSLSNTLAERILAEHQSLASERVQASLNFFRSEAAERDSERAERLQALIDFKKNNTGLLPEDRQRYLDLHRTLIRQQYGTAPPPRRRQAQDQLFLELDAARALYAADHPRVRFLASRVGNLSGLPVEPLIAHRNQEIASRLKQIDQRLSAIPANELNVDALQQEYDLAQTRYQQAIARLEDVTEAAKLAEKQSGESLVFVGPAHLSALPQGPRMKIVLAIGLALSICAAAAAAILRNRMDGKIRRGIDIERGLSLTPYAVIPAMSAR